MRTAVADTSLLAFDRLRESPRLSAQELAVLRALNESATCGRVRVLLDAGALMNEAPTGALTRAEIAAAAGIRHSSACGRVRALLDAGVLIEEPRRICRVTGESAHPVRLAALQRELFAA